MLTLFERVSQLEKEKAALKTKLEARIYVLILVVAALVVAFPPPC